MNEHILYNNLIANLTKQLEEKELEIKTQLQKLNKSFGSSNENELS